MDKLNDILNNIKERFTNPLIFSFICSWVVINWKITISLFADTQQIEKEGFNSIFAFIQDKINADNLLWAPLAVAIGYTLLIPIIRNLIKVFNSWAYKWGENWNLKILKERRISIDKYLKLRQQYEKRSEILEDIITKESEHINNINSMQTELHTANNYINEANQKINEHNAFITQMSDYRLLNGAWENTYAFEDGTKGTETAFIEDGRYYIPTTLGQKEHIFNITNFFYDNRNRNVSFIKELVSQQKATRPKTQYYNFNQLRFENKDLIVGAENGETQVAYRRK